MKVDFTQQLRTLQGDAIQEDDGSGGKRTATLGSLAVSVLLLSDPERPEPGAKKVAAYHLAQRIYGATGNGSTSVTAEEVALIKEKIGQWSPPLVCGQAWDMLEGRETAPIDNVEIVRKLA
jgi:hypothetical protein